MIDTPQIVQTAAQSPPSSASLSPGRFAMSWGRSRA